MSIIVHGIIGSPFVRSVLMTLEEKGQDYRLTAIPPGAQKSPEFLKLHPFGRVPAIEHDGFHLYETQAIIRYFDRVFPEPSLTPKDPKRAARMDQIIGVSDWYVFQKAAAPISFNRVVAPMFGWPVDEAAIEAAIPMARTAVDEVERLLDDQPFMTGDTLSLADILIAPPLEFLAMSPEGADIISGHVRLLEWMGRMDTRPSMKATAMPQLQARFGG